VERDQAQSYTSGGTGRDNVHIGGMQKETTLRVLFVEVLMRMPQAVAVKRLEEQLLGLKTFILPVCDGCGEAWLPDKRTAYKGIQAREDPRAYHAARIKDGLPGLRCGKCKAFGWDREYLGDGRRKCSTPAAHEVEVEIAPIRQRCAKHGLFHCPQCSKEV